MREGEGGREREGYGYELAKFRISSLASLVLKSLITWCPNKQLSIRYIGYYI